MTRRIVVGMFQSLDGVMQAPGARHEDDRGGFTLGGWTVPLFDYAVGMFMDARFEGDFDLLLARETYDIFAAHWPNQAGDALADRINACTKYVVTHRPDDLGWHNVRPLGDMDAVAAVRAGDGPDLIVQGSPTLHGPLIAAGLVDELFLLTFPVVLGKGKRGLTGDTAAGFRMIEHSVSPSGVVMTRYAPAGPVATGSFA